MFSDDRRGGDSPGGITCFRTIFLRPLRRVNFMGDADLEDLAVFNKVYLHLI